MFDTYALSERTLAALRDHQFSTPTPIQAATIPQTLAGRDVVAQARTGTGKTLAFALPIAERLDHDAAEARAPRAMVLAPTRELALQVADEIGWVAPHLRVTTVYGGTGYGRQASELKRGTDVVVATPGRAVDYYRQGVLSLSAVQIVVLDEADEMLSMGFQEELEILLGGTPGSRQTLLFSATMPAWAKRLSDRHLSDPLRVSVVQEENISYRELTLEVADRSRVTVLSDLLHLHYGARAIVFTHTKAEVDALVQALNQAGHAADAVHGDLNQGERERAVSRLRSGGTTILIGTNVAARGLDIPEVDLVVHYRVPSEAGVYQHRSGRTGRAGRQGTVVVMHTRKERHGVRGIERTLQRRFETMPAPQSDEVQSAKLASLVSELESQDETAKQSWRELARQWIDQGNVEAVAGLLARALGGASAPRSLLTGEEGWSTTMLKGNVTEVPHAVRALKRAGARDLGRIQPAQGGVYADLRDSEIEGVSTRLDAGLTLRRAKDTLELRVHPQRRRAPGRSRSSQASQVR